MAETYDIVHSKYSSLSGWATIDYADSLGGYEWDEIHVLRGPDGALYVGEGGGCSCNSFGDDGPGGFTRVNSWAEARKEIQNWIGDERGYGRESVGLELISRLNANPPKGRIEHDPTKGFKS